MWMALLPLLSSLFGANGPIGQYFATKAQTAQAQIDLQLQIEKDKFELSKEMAEAQIQQITAQLNCTSQNFKQNTFWFLCVPIVFTMLFPNKAAIMWANFNTIPQMFQWLFMTVYGSIWGVPLTQDGHSLILGLLQQRSDNKVAQIQASQLDETALANKARELLFPKGMTNDEWESIRSIAKAGCDINGDK